jgi:hypothetical protein
MQGKVGSSSFWYAAGRSLQLAVAGTVESGAGGLARRGGRSAAWLDAEGGSAPLWRPRIDGDVPRSKCRPREE